jgi:hypothetical protein
VAPSSSSRIGAQVRDRRRQMVAAAAASIEKSSFVTQPTLSTFKTSMSTLKISMSKSYQI